MLLLPSLRCCSSAFELIPQLLVCEAGRTSNGRRLQGELRHPSVVSQTQIQYKKNQARRPSTCTNHSARADKAPINSESPKADLSRAFKNCLSPSGPFVKEAVLSTSRCKHEVCCAYRTKVVLAGSCAFHLVCYSSSSF